MVDEHRHSGCNLSLQRALLRAAAEETAPPDVYRRALAALGLLVVAPPARLRQRPLISPRLAAPLRGERC